MGAVQHQWLISNSTLQRFRTGRPELGYSAHMMGGDTLIIETVSKSKKPQSHKVKFAFQPFQWYMLTVLYVHNRVRNCQMTCYVNGKSLLHVETVVLPSTDDVSGTN